MQVILEIEKQLRYTCQHQGSNSFIRVMIMHRNKTSILGSYPNAMEQGKVRVWCWAELLESLFGKHQITGRILIGDYLGRYLLKSKVQYMYKLEKRDRKIQEYCYYKEQYLRKCGGS